MIYMIIARYSFKVLDKVFEQFNNLKMLNNNIEMPRNDLKVFNGLDILNGYKVFNNGLKTLTSLFRTGWLTRLV